MVGWVQAIAFSAFGMTVVGGIVHLAEKYLQNRHERQKMEMKRQYKLVDEIEDDE